ncbi:acyl-CoA thioesterase domain-containing protein [Streptomyces sp. NPDC048496]|uniref:acyl-CoA thioesterase domain-containing protein n=1 Tax=Streptomyces sp. NPDC048496 TaxID=3365558 RepID=UPI00371727AD
MAEGIEGFYERVGAGRYVAGEYTRGPWDARAQHAGPQAALLGREIEERAEAREDMRLAQVTYEILRPVPIGPLRVTTEVVRAGRGSRGAGRAPLKPGACAGPILRGRATPWCGAAG